MLKQNRITPLQELTLLDRFLFDETMEDLEACQAMLEISLESEQRITLLCAESEKEMRTSPDMRSIRLDIFAQDEEEKIYNTEMQKKNTGNLPRRSRYYQAHLDVALLEIGETDFNALNDSYMILIAPFDLFGKGKYRYTFKMYCEEDPSIKLDDGAVRIFLNTKGTDQEGVSQELIDLLKYIEHPDEKQARNSESPRIEKIHKRVCKIKASEEMGVRYMQAWEEKIYIRRDGIEEGEVLKLISLIQKKVNKGKSLDIIAEELEEKTEVIQPIYALVKDQPDTDIEEIYEQLYGPVSFDY